LVFGQITHNKVVARFSLQKLGECVTSNSGGNGVLNIGYVNLKARGLLAVYF
jgi:hypothetical protein